MVTTQTERDARRAIPPISFSWKLALFAIVVSCIVVAVIVSTYIADRTGNPFAAVAMGSTLAVVACWYGVGLMVQVSKWIYDRLK